MARRGESQGIGLVISIVLGLLVAALVIWFLMSGGKAFKGTFTCDLTDAQYACVPRSQGCGEEYSIVTWKFWGCDKKDGQGQMCCIQKSDEERGITTAPKEVKLFVRAYSIQAALPAQFTDKTPAVTINALDTLAGGKTLTPVVGRGEPVMIEVEIANCDAKCNPDDVKLLFTAETRAGEDVLTRVADRLKVSKDKKTMTWEEITPDPDGNKVIEAMQKFPASADRRLVEKTNSVYGDRNFLFTFPQDYAGETVTFRARATYTLQGEDAKTLDEDITIFLKPRPAVKYGGLTANWQQQKTITAICEDPVKCSGIYYEIIPGPTKTAEGVVVQQPSCPARTKDQLASAQEITVASRWCVIDENGQTGSCHDTEAACIQLGLGQYNDPAYSQAFELLNKKLKEGAIPQDVAVLWQQQENKVSRRSCQPDLKIISSETDAVATEGLLYRPFKAVQPDAGTPRWTFTLALPSMQDQYLCVYGQSKDSDAVYTAGAPQQIKIDRTPPSAWIDFSPGSLTISFYCQDTGSGCDETKRSVAYVGAPIEFFSALFTNNPQSAVQYCPKNAYRLESRQQITYTDGLVRVLCLRVADKAGNQGYALTTVYNTYSLLAATLQKYAEERAEKERAQLP